MVLYQTADRDVQRTPYEHTATRPYLPSIRQPGPCCTSFTTPGSAEQRDHGNRGRCRPSENPGRGETAFRRYSAEKNSAAAGGEARQRIHEEAEPRYRSALRAGSGLPAAAGIR